MIVECKICGPENGVVAEVRITGSTKKHYICWNCGKEFTTIDDDDTE